MKQEAVHDFFHNVSRITIILPIVIIALGIVLKAGKPSIPPVQNNPVASVAVISPTIVISPTDIPINLQGPMICTFDSKSEYNGTLYIKNNNVYANLLPKNKETTTSILLKDDCVYKWQTGAKTGVKVCNVSQYVSMINMLSSLKALDANSLMTIIAQFGEANGAKNLPKNVPPPRCGMGNIADTIFTIPKAVQFQLKSVATPSPSSK